VTAEILPMIRERTVCLTCAFYSRDGYCWEQGRIVPEDYVCSLWERALLPIKPACASPQQSA
jgi:hypothetical protein